MINRDIEGGKWDQFSEEFSGIHQETFLRALTTIWKFYKGEIRLISF
jgi:hypothetical protein